MGSQATKKVTATATVVATPQKLMGIAVTKAGAAGADRIEIKDGGAGGTSKIIVDADNPLFIPLEIECTTDIHATVTGTTALYIVIWQ